MRDHLFFGCWNERLGHHLYDRDGNRPHSVDFSINTMYRKMEEMDGVFAPQFDRRPYRGVVSRLGSFGYTVIGLWDHSVDTRSGSNCVFWCPGLDYMSDVQVLHEAQTYFPQIFARFPRFELLTHGILTPGTKSQPIIVEG